MESTLVAAAEKFNEDTLGFFPLNARGFTILATLELLLPVALGC